MLGHRKQTVRTPSVTASRESIGRGGASFIFQIQPAQHQNIEQKEKPPASVVTSTVTLCSLSLSVLSPIKTPFQTLQCLRDQAWTLMLFPADASVKLIRGWNVGPQQF